MHIDQIAQYIPPDKSELMRYGVLNLIDGNDYTLNYIDSLEKPAEDVRSLYRASVDWNDNKPVRVGESGTLYRFLKFAAWSLKENKNFVLEGSLKNREIHDDSKIIYFSLRDLLELDGGTSQWASAAVLIGDNSKVYNAPVKLKLTQICRKKWIENKKIEPGLDSNLLRQAKTFFKKYNGEETYFEPLQAEDYCFARAFDYITTKQGNRRWKQLRYHESDRLEEMEKELNNLDENKPILSKDHRVVQSISMLAKYKGIGVDIKYPESVNKSWPSFWDFLYEV